MLANLFRVSKSNVQTTQNMLMDLNLAQKLWVYNLLFSPKSFKTTIVLVYDLPVK